MSKDDAPALSGAATPPAEDDVIDKSSGFKVYRPDVRAVLVESLRTKKTGKSLSTELVEIHETKEIVDPGASAFTTARLVHGLGRSVWVTPTLLNNNATTRYLYFSLPPHGTVTPDGSVIHNPSNVTTPPPGLDVALLVSYAQAWPDITANSGPAPPIPDQAPPPIPTY
jgi:hypothetical protein